MPWCQATFFRSHFRGRQHRHNPARFSNRKGSQDLRPAPAQRHHPHGEGPHRLIVWLVGAAYRIEAHPGPINIFELDIKIGEPTGASVGLAEITGIPWGMVIQRTIGGHGKPGSRPKKTGNFREFRKSNRLFAAPFTSEDHAALLAQMR